MGLEMGEGGVMNIWRAIPGCCIVCVVGLVLVPLFYERAHRMDHLCKPPPLFPMYCPWCAVEGIETIVDMSPVPSSSAICERHAETWLKDIYDYIVQDNPSAAARVVQGIYEKAQLLAQFLRLATDIGQNQKVKYAF